MILDGRDPMVGLQTPYATRWFSMDASFLTFFEEWRRMLYVDGTLAWRGSGRERSPGGLGDEDFRADGGGSGTPRHQLGVRGLSRI